MDELYYISYFDRANLSLRFPHDIILKELESFQSSLEIINSIDFDLDLFFDNAKNIKETDSYPSIMPNVITNDSRLYSKYRNTFTESEFHSYCIKWTEKQTQSKNKYLQSISDYSKLAGFYGEQTFEHFLNIKEGLYQEARMYTKYDYWDDEQTSNQYEVEVESGWKTEKIGKTFIVIQSEKIGEKKYRNTLKNENNPNRLFILDTDRFNEPGTTNKLDMSQFEIEEKGQSEKTVFVINIKKS